MRTDTRANGFLVMFRNAINNGQNNEFIIRNFVNVLKQVQGARRLQQDYIHVCMFDKRYMDIVLKAKYSMSTALFHHEGNATS
jgi:hypothetical protein